MKFKTNLQPSSSLIDLTPLVDVIFLMLVFFIITADILPLKSLNIESPELNIVSTPKTTQLLVVMDAQNVIYVGSKKEIVDLDSFKPTLVNELVKNHQRHPGADLTIVLSIDRRVEYGMFLKLFAHAQETGAKLRLVYNDSPVEMTR